MIENIPVEHVSNPDAPYNAPEEEAAKYLRVPPTGESVEDGEDPQDGEEHGV